jgi:hypothetical protein
VQVIRAGEYSVVMSVALKAAEAELEQCKAMSAGHKRPARRASMEPLQKRVDRMLKRLSQGGEVARSVLREVFPESIWLQVAPSGRHFYAVFEDGVRAALFDDSMNLAEFPIEQPDAGLRKVGEIGSGGEHCHAPGRRFMASERACEIAGYAPQLAHLGVSIGVSESKFGHVVSSRLASN